MTDETPVKAAKPESSKQQSGPKVGSCEVCGGLTHGGEPCGRCGHPVG